MRLDHLLSKEHIPSLVDGVPSGVQTDRVWVCGAQRIVELLVKTPSALRLVSLSTARVFECGKAALTVRAGGVFGTLLGPERTPARGCLEEANGPVLLLAFIPPAVKVGSGVAWCGGVWLFFENYTVDASIFVVKLLRAYGGCLGTRSR